MIFNTALTSKASTSILIGDNMSKQEEERFKDIFARFRKICVENADDPIVKATVQTLNDTKVVVNKED